MLSPQTEQELWEHIRYVAAAGPSEKPAAFKLAARSVAGMVVVDKIQKRDAADRLKDYAQAQGLVSHYGGEDGLQTVLSECFDNPIVPDDDGGPLPDDQPKWKGRLKSASELRTMTFKPVTYVLPGYITQGLTILASKPKSGKSWLMLDVCIAVASERFTLGDLKPQQGDVLYLALEDSTRRLQTRLDKLLSPFSAEWPPRLEFATEWPKLNAGGLADLEAWCQEHPQARLIVIDTFEKVRPPVNGKGPTYGLDYEAMTPLHALAHRRNIAIVIIHHTRKMEADDIFDTVSGSLGLTGAADTTLILQKTSGGIRLHAVGRDIEEKTTAVEFNKGTCRWTILGEAAEVQRSSARTPPRRSGPSGPRGRGPRREPGLYSRQGALAERAGDVAGADKGGARKSSVPDRAPIRYKTMVATAVTDAEVEVAATYFASIKPRSIVRVVEAGTVPKTYVTGWHLALDKAGGNEPIGARIIEVPADLARFVSRDSRLRFTAYVPI